MASKEEVVRKLTGWFGLVSAGLLQVILAIMHLASISATLRWPQDGFLDDVNGIGWFNNAWRRLFTFVPSLLMDNWTPMLFGLSGVAAHIKRFKTTRGITNDYGSYLCFVVISALWASMGYVGNFGFIVGMFELLTGLFCVVGLLMDQDGSPFLDIELKASTEDVNVQL